MRHRFQKYYMKQNYEKSPKDPKVGAKVWVQNTEMGLHRGFYRKRQESKI